MIGQALDDVRTRANRLLVVQQAVDAPRFGKLHATGAPSSPAAPRHRNDLVREQNGFVQVVCDHDRGHRSAGSEHSAPVPAEGSRASTRPARRTVRPGTAPPVPPRKPVRWPRAAAFLRRAGSAAVQGVAQSDRLQKRSACSFCLARDHSGTRGSHRQANILQRRKPRQQRIVLKHDRRRGGSRSTASRRWTRPCRAAEQARRIFSSVDLPDPMSRRSKQTRLRRPRGETRSSTCRPSRTISKVLSFDEMPWLQRPQPASASPSTDPA